MAASDEIRESIERRLRDLATEIEALTAAREALIERHAREASESSSRRPGSRRGASRRRRARSAQAREVVPAGKLELLLSNSGDSTTTALAERANAERGQVLTLLQELEAAGRVRRMGQRRGTRWRLITDEDRIEQRAAELAARSRARPA